MEILDILKSARIRSLEDMIYGYVEFGKFSSTIEELGIAEMRKQIIDKALLDNCADALREDILHFDKQLRREVKKMEKLCRETWYNIVGDEEFLGPEDLKLRGKISIGSDYPPLHPLQGDDRQTIWDLLVDEYYRSNKAYVRTEKMIWNFEDQERREGRMPNPKWRCDMKECCGNDFLDNLNLSVGFRKLYKHSFLALTDLIYVRTFETEVKIIEEPEIHANRFRSIC